MAISSTVKTIIPYIKQAGAYVKLMISSKAVKMASGNDLETELNSKLKWSGWINLTSKIGLTARYRTCGMFTELAIYGKISSAGFTANTGYSFGSLPVKARPTFANKIQLTDSRLYIDIAASGDVSIKSWTNASGVQSNINFTTLFPSV